MQTDSHGQPQQEDLDNRIATDAEQTMSLNTAQAAQQLCVEARTVRRWITEGVLTPDGAILRLQARSVKNGREYQIYQTDLEDFRRKRDRLATEGQIAGQRTRSAEESQSQALATSLQLFAAELERRSQALSQAQDTIERLAREAGRQVGRNEELERERTTLHKRLTARTPQHKPWRPSKAPHRIHLLPWPAGRVVIGHGIILTTRNQLESGTNEQNEIC